MGSGTYNHTASATRAKVRASTGATAFDHHASAAAGKVDKLHPSLDFRTKMLRESRDVDGKPVATPIAVLCDVTGSMRDIPEHVIAELHKLMKLIIDGKVVTDPQICFGGIGDATCDYVPFQLGEFEANDELAEKDLSNLYLEGHGGGQNMETYELFMYAFANHVHTDAYEKRGEKGLMFIIGDEAPYPEVDKNLVKQHLGIDIDENIPLKEIARKLQEKWEVFCIRPAGTFHIDDPQIQEVWETIIPPERVTKANDWKEIVPNIAGTISIMAGNSLDDVVEALKDSGFDDAAVDGATTALMPLSKVAVPVVTSDGSTPPDTEPAGERL